MAWNIGFSYIDFDVSSKNIYYQLHQPNLYLLLLFLDEKPVLINVTIFKISFTQKKKIFKISYKPPKKIYLIDSGAFKKFFFFLMTLKSEL